MADKFYVISDQHAHIQDQIYIEKRQHEVHHFTCIAGFYIDICV